MAFDSLTPFLSLVSPRAGAYCGTAKWKTIKAMIAHRVSVGSLETTMYTSLLYIYIHIHI